MDEAPASLGEIMTLAEAADRLQLHPNALARAARAAGRGSLFGRSLRFTDADLAAILEHRRVEQTERQRPATPYAHLSSEQIRTKMRAITAARKRQSR